MLKLKLTIAFALFFTSISFGQNPDVIIGKYRLPNKLDVEIFKQNGKYFGKIIALNEFENGQQKDINNSDQTRQADSLIGMLIIKNLEYEQKENKWLHGSMYSPEKGLIFNLKITENRDDEIVVVGSKYIMWRTLKWKKI
ncbi:MAG: DUF2147 domain-containing protein [Bacteroidales bacterium]|jgi:uncharacterized protein (DUF2147 family)|nr:DUF2147 domain-containing protein [Bacteroidales bacterium]